MYHIYHIPNVKIGCSTEVKVRVAKQGFTEYEILETHTDIYKVSNRELELQKQYGYPVDNIPYYISCQNFKKGTTKESCSKGGKAPRKHHGQKTKEVSVETIYGETVGVYESLSQAARDLGLYKANIYNTLSGRHGATQHKGYRFKYV